MVLLYIRRSLLYIRRSLLYIRRSSFPDQSSGKANVSRQTATTVLWICRSSLLDVLSPKSISQHLALLSSLELLLISKKHLLVYKLQTNHLHTFRDVPLFSFLFFSPLNKLTSCNYDMWSLCNALVLRVFTFALISCLFPKNVPQTLQPLQIEWTFALVSSLIIFCSAW